MFSLRTNAVHSSYLSLPHQPNVSAVGKLARSRESAAARVAVAARSFCRIPPIAFHRPPAFIRPSRRFIATVPDNSVPFSAPYNERP